jgi:sugar/nucleoside kinase (ribokinase family)
MFSKKSIPILEKSVSPNSLKVADSQVASRWGNILDFKNYDLITPNEKEVRFALADQDTVIRPLAADLFRRAKCRVLILKLGERGAMTFRGPNERVRDFFQIDSMAEHVKDPVGAGDALLAYASIGLEVTKSALKASLLGMIAAALACEKMGNTPVQINEMLEKISKLDLQMSKL